MDDIAFQGFADLRNELNATSPIPTRRKNKPVHITDQTPATHPVPAKIKPTKASELRPAELYVKFWFKGISPYGSAKNARMPLPIRNDPKLLKTDTQLVSSKFWSPRRFPSVLFISITNAALTGQNQMNWISKLASSANFVDRFFRSLLLDL